MAEGDGAIYRNFKEEVMEGLFDLSTHVIQVALVAAYVPNTDTHSDWTDVSTKEVTGTGYTANGIALAGKAVTEAGTGATGHGMFDASNVTWAGLNIGGISGAPSHAVMWDNAHATDALIAYWEVTTATNGGNYALQWHVNGIITLT